ncbi:MAG: DEAD/DEAH box helicase, partial [Actinobacteria bacterium]|nr:DEAD/DEAH box helicase [Actinomycetota bacterium]
MRGLVNTAGPSATHIVAPAPLYPFLIAARADATPILVITSSSRSAEDLVSELSELHSNVMEFPAWETLPHERLSPRSDTVAKRIQTLYALNSAHSVNPIVVTPVRGAIHRIIAQLGKAPLMKLEIGKEQSLDELVRHLGALAYARTDLVERRGEFAVRGGIVDLFLPLSAHPIRIDFFGDEIEDLSYFEVADQRTFEPVIGSIEIYPCRELLLTALIKARALTLKSELPAAAELLEKISEGIVFEGMESLIPLLIDETETLLARMPANTQVIFIDQERIKSRAGDLLATNEEFLNASWSNAAHGAIAPIHDGSGTYMSWVELVSELERCGLASNSLSPFGSDLAEDTEFLDYSAIDPMRGDIDRTIDALRTAVEAHFTVVFATHGHGMLERYAGIFRNADLPVHIVEKLIAKPTRGSVHLTTSVIAHGFESASDQIFFMTERDLTGSKGSVKDGDRLPSKRKQAIDPLELRAGDFVVHEQHGIGRYVELLQRTVAGVTREYLVIEYASAKRGQPGDRVFVPTDALEQVSKYVGGEAPTVHRIGSGEWQKAKSRARKAVRQIAGELIRLYAARTSSPGFAFSPDTPWQRELEDSFSYIETPDQLSTINDVKRDMERPYPMDRIICGDVGYGKTEIAIRAAFKAVQDGKQVAVLVPTTLLVQQHTKVFSERYAGFPLKVAGLSRFNTAKESKEVIEGLLKGTVDVVIGTHRILSSDVVFRDLGLVIVDEEQRFGVEQKEALKKMRTTVDVLAMSATPIPRTLEMAVTGIREMSTITTPPEERHPILTYVGPAEEGQITAAI